MLLEDNQCKCSTKKWWLQFKPVLSYAHQSLFPDLGLSSATCGELPHKYNAVTIFDRYAPKVILIQNHRKTKDSKHAAFEA